MNIIDLWALVTGGSYLDIVFSGPVVRFGFYSSDLGTSNPMHAFTVSSVEFYADDTFTNLIETFATPVDLGPAPGFYGLESDSAFRAVRINFQDYDDGGFSPYLDDFRFEAASVPEPSMFGVVGMIAGIGGILMGRRRKRV